MLSCSFLLVLPIMFWSWQCCSFSFDKKVLNTSFEHHFLYITNFELWCKWSQAALNNFRILHGWAAHPQSVSNSWCCGALVHFLVWPWLWSNKKTKLYLGKHTCNATGQSHMKFSSYHYRLQCQNGNSKREFVFRAPKNFSHCNFAGDNLHWLMQNADLIPWTQTQNHVTAWQKSCGFHPQT